MNPWQKAALVMDPRAMQVATYLQHLNQQKEEHDQRRQVFQMEMEDRQRKRAHEDFTTALSLHDAGFLPVHPGMVGKFEAGMGGRDTVTAPSGTQYSQPTPEQRFQRASVAAQQSGRLKGIETKAAEDVTQPNETLALPDTLGGGTAEVKKSAKIDKLLEIYKVANPKREYHATTPNDKGQVTVWSVDPQKGDIRTEKTLDDAGKTARPAGGASIPNFDAQVKQRMDDWRQGHYATLGITPDVVAAAKGAGQGILDEAHNQAANRVREAENVLYSRAVDSLKNEAKGNRPGVTVAPVPTISAGDQIKRAVKVGKPMPSKNVPAAAKGLGLTVEEFSQQWHAAGGTIAP